MIEILRENKVGFLPSQSHTLGKEVVSTISQALWFIDPHRQKFESRGIYFPAPFDALKGFNDPKKNKKAIPSMVTEIHKLGVILIKLLYKIA